MDQKQIDNLIQQIRTAMAEEIKTQFKTIKDAIDKQNEILEGMKEETIA